MNQIGGLEYLPKLVWFAYLEEIRGVDSARKYLSQKPQTGISKWWKSSKIGNMRE